MVKELLQNPEWILVFLSGFVTVKIYSLFYSPLDKTRKDVAYDIIAYGVMNSTIYYLIVTLGGVWELIGFIIPVVVAYIYAAVRARKFFPSLQDPWHSSWEYFFLNIESSCGVIVHFKDGSKVCGVYGGNSYSSSPYDKDIFLEKAYRFKDNDDSDCAFEEVDENSNGIWIPISEVKMLEFTK